MQMFSLEDEMPIVPNFVAEANAILFVCNGCEFVLHGLEHGYDHSKKNYFQIIPINDAAKINIDLLYGYFDCAARNYSYSKRVRFDDNSALFLHKAESLDAYHPEIVMKALLMLMTDYAQCCDAVQKTTDLEGLFQFVKRFAESDTKHWSLSSIVSKLGILRRIDNYSELVDLAGPLTSLSVGSMGLRRRSTPCLKVSLLKL